MSPLFQEASSEDELDQRVRLAAFEFLTQQTQLHGDDLPRALLSQGFDFLGKRIPLLGPQGIFKPAILSEMPLSITTAPVVPGAPRPYDDKVGPDGLLRYRYRGTNPRHPDNVRLRRALERQRPLVYFFGIVPGRYMPAWPAYIVADDPGGLTFSVAIDEVHSSEHVHSLFNNAPNEPLVTARRRYVTASVRQRLHQQTFREKVLLAYQARCAICRLRHQELLEAAHILPDGHPQGEPIVPNGIALCKLHHAAFDRQILGIRPDLLVEIRNDILEEEDGPMLQWGLQHFQGASLHVPKRGDLRPKREFLEERYALFRGA